MISDEMSFPNHIALMDAASFIRRKNSLRSNS
jgi:hypothetical protein